LDLVLELEPEFLKIILNFLVLDFFPKKSGMGVNHRFHTRLPRTGTGSDFQNGNLNFFHEPTRTGAGVQFFGWNWNHSNFIKNHNWRFFIKVKNLPTLVVSLTVTQSGDAVPAIVSTDDVAASCFFHPCLMLISPMG
jgi:hypothetical protein